MHEAPGALEELVHDDGSRRRFMKIVGTGGAGAFATLLAACGSSSKSSSTPTPPPTTTASKPAGGDLGILNYALTLEYLETAFYKKVNDAKIFKGKPGELVKQFGDEEAQHVDALIATIKKLGGKPVAEPKSKFPLGN